MYDGTAGGRDVSKATTDWFWTGIGVKKFVHPESKSGASAQRQKQIPYPIIRMADLYLMKAEAENEVHGAAAALDAINKVRQRAGIPDVDKVWADPALVTDAARNKHQTQDGMRDIILQERSIELAFEGSYYRDMHRHKRAVVAFNSPIQGWRGEQQDYKSFFQLEIKETRRFTLKDYLFPINTSEREVNSKLIQNPGW
jgi:hypothetical protein